MFFINKKNIEKKAQVRKNIEKMSAEISEIWSGENKREHTDVSGSYTGNPIGYEIPEQDSDDL